MKVYQSINKVQLALSKVGISKDSKNVSQNFNFRGIDAVYNTLSPMLAEHGLCILPRMLSRSCEERVSAKGSAMFSVTVEAEFDLVCAEDGSKHTIKTFGEAMDSGDKATNKAMSAAYKYACFQAFAIPTEGDNDADAHTHEVKPSVKPAAKAEGMSASGIADNLASINDATDVDTLKQVFASAYRLGQAAGDTNAMGKFQSAYNARKEALGVA